MTRAEKYDPHDHAERLGIKVVYRKLTTGNGLWVPDLSAIFLQPRMRVVHERSVLAHELGHACLGHRDDRPKHELAADRFAARHLVDPDHLADVHRISTDPNVWANEIGVTLDLLETWFHMNGRSTLCHAKRAA